MKRLGIVFLVFALLGMASVALGQTVPNPRLAEFTASADHAAITSYEIGWFLGAATTPVSVVDVGKPTPDTVTGCSAPVPCVQVTINVMPLPFAEYTAKVRAKVTGTPAIYSEWSDASNPFQRVPGKPGKPVTK